MSQKYVLFILEITLDYRGHKIVIKTGPIVYNKYLGEPHIAIVQFALLSVCLLPFLLTVQKIDRIWASINYYMYLNLYSAMPFHKSTFLDLF